MREIERIEAMGVAITCSYRVDDVLAEKEAGRFDAVFLAIGAHVGNHLDIPSMDGGQMIDALQLLEQVEQGRAPKLGRVVGIVGGGNTAMDAARVARRLGAEEAILIYRSDREHMRAHPDEADEAFAEGVKVKWLSTVKQFGNDEITVEQMEMLPDGSGTIGTGKFERLKTDSLVLAVGQHADVGFLKALSGIAARARRRGRSRRRMSTGQPGVFAGGDMIGGARTMTAAVGHGKKAARAIDAWLRGDRVRARAQASPSFISTRSTCRCSSTPTGARPRRSPLRSARASTRSSPASPSGRRATRPSRCLSCGNCFECDNCYAVCPEQAIVKLGEGRFYRFDYDLCTGCAVCFEQCPCHAIEMEPEPAASVTEGGDIERSNARIVQGAPMTQSGTQACPVAGRP